MKIFPEQRGIRNKLILFVFGSIILTLIMIGGAFDVLLKKTFEEGAAQELEHAYNLFKTELDVIESDIVLQTHQTVVDESIVATIELVNRYQDISNYQPLIFDNDKKKVAKGLLDKLLLSGVGSITIYEKSGELIAYAHKKNNKVISGFVTYENGFPVYLGTEERSDIWTRVDLPHKVFAKVGALESRGTFIAYSGKINYLTYDEEFVIENSQPVKRINPDGSSELIGIVTVSASLDEKYFRDISGKAHSNVSLFLQNNVLFNDVKGLLPMADLKANSALLGGITQKPYKLIENDAHFVKSYVWPTESGNNYLFVSSPKSSLFSALNRIRILIVIIFLIVASLVIVVSIYWLNSLITRPLDRLIKNAGINDAGGYPSFPESRRDDEISILASVLNRMVATIRRRERELKQSEARLSRAQKLAKIGGWEVDHTSNAVQWSSEIFSILGLDSQQDKPLHDMFATFTHPDDLDIVEGAYARSISEKTPYDVTHRLKMNDDSVKYVRVYAETEFDNEGRPFITSGTMQDVTEQMVKDETLRRTQKMDALGKLTGGIAHDFNNMLNVIIGYSDILKKSLSDNPKLEKFAEEINSAGKRNAKLTRKLLSFSSENDSNEAASISINDVLRDEQHMLEKTLTVSIDLVLNLSDRLWLTYLDEDELQDAVLNMSINSMHAMPIGGQLTIRTLNVSLTNEDVSNMDIPAGDYVLLSVADTGTGMDRETLQHVFEPFYSTKKDMGTGLGMSQVYGFVTSAKGSIHVHSEPGHGTLLTLYFPRHYEQVSVQADEQTIVNDEELCGDASILVVDDEPFLRIWLEEILTMHGYKVLCAEGGEQALAMLKEEQIDLMLSDVIMPGMNGFELAREVEQLYPNIIIQMASGYAGDDSTHIASEELYQKLLKKPFTEDELLQRIHDLLTADDSSQKEMSTGKS